MAIDKSLPSLGGETFPGASVDVDLSVLDAPASDEYEVTELEDGGLEVNLDPSDLVEAGAVPFDANLADYIDESELTLLAGQMVHFYEKDESSRSEWKEVYKKGLDLLGLKIEDRTEPWKGACGITHPLLSEAAVRFQSQEIGEMFPAAGPVRVKLVGKETVKKIAQGVRVKDRMNHLITEEMEEYREECDKMLFVLPLAGSAFKKTYWDPTLDRPVSDYVPAEDLVVASGTKTLGTCRRLTHVMQEDPNDIRKLIAAGFYRDTAPLGGMPEFGDVEEKKGELVGIEHDYDDGELVTILEVHVDADIKGFEDKLEDEPTGIALPYVITIDKARRQVLSVRRNWLEDDEKKKKRQHFTHYQYIPGFGFYGFGLIHLIGGIAKGSTSILRQLVDSGTLSNLQGGYKSRGMRVKGDGTPVAPGEWRDVDVPAGKISDNLFPMPYGEPSQVLSGLLGSIVEEGRRFASLTDINISSMNNEAPVGTTLALLERNLKVMTAVAARIHSSQRREFKILVGIVADHYTEYPYDLEDDTINFSEDFDGRVDVLPVSDPNSSTMAQRIMTMQTALQLASQAPHLYSGLKTLHRRMLHALEIQDVDEIIPSEEDIKMLDPVSENFNILTGVPVKAHKDQDHESHISSHMYAMQDPQAQELLEQSPTAQQSVAANMAHVTEHLGYKYRQEIEQALGVPLPEHGEELPQEVEAQLSKLIAEAAAKLFNRHSAEQSEEETREKLEDPIVQDQLRNTAIKEQDSATKAKDQEDKIQIKLAELVQKEEHATAKLEQERELETERIRAQILGNLFRAASETERLDSAERQKLSDFIIAQVKEEGDGVRAELEKKVSTGDANMKMLVDLINKSYEGGEG